MEVLTSFEFNGVKAVVALRAALLIKSISRLKRFGIYQPRINCKPPPIGNIEGVDYYLND